MENTFISDWLKFFFLLTPFFVLSVFLTYTSHLTMQERRNTAIRVTVAVMIIGGLFVCFGGYLFQLFGITLDAFRVGAGLLLLLSGITLAREGKKAGRGGDEDIKIAAVVPLAIPVTVGPATTGALLVMGADMREKGIQLQTIAGLIAAILTVGAMMYLSAQLEKILGDLGITILSRLTGLILVALASQIMFDGIRGLLLLK